MKKEVSYVVKGEEWEKAKDKAFNKLNAKYRIDGFRQGKAPRSVFEKKRPGEIVMEAANSVIDDKYREIVLDKENMPVVRPSVEIKKLTDDMVEVVFIVITEPEVKLGEYKMFTSLHRLQRYGIFPFPPSFSEGNSTHLSSAHSQVHTASALSSPPP